MPLLFGLLPTQQNNIGFVALAAISPRTRDFFAAIGKFAGFERVAPVPAAAGHVPCAFPGAQRGGGEREGAQGEPADKQSSMKKAPGQMTWCFLAHPREWER